MSSVMVGSAVDWGWRSQGLVFPSTVEGYSKELDGEREGMVAWGGDGPGGGLSSLITFGLSEGAGRARGWRAKGWRGEELEPMKVR